MPVRLGVAALCTFATVAVSFSSLASTPTAQAASATTYVTRGQYVEQLLQAVGDQPASNAQQSFSDVPPSSPYFGWVEAAYKAGITTGTVAPANGKMGVFGLNADLTRAEAAAFDLRAYDSGVATYAQEKSTWYGRGIIWNPSDPAYNGAVSFNDYLDIPTALQGDVYVASSIGLLHGFPDGTFGPQQNLTSAQTADLISQLKAVEATGGQYNWRWFLSMGGLNGEIATGNILNMFADAVQGLPYSQVSQYVDPADQSAVAGQYAEVIRSVNQVRNGGLDGTKDATLKIVSGALALSHTYNGATLSVDNLVVEAVANGNGKPNIADQGYNLPVENSPYIKLQLDVVTDSSGLVTQFVPALSNSELMTISSGETVADVTMGFVGSAGFFYADTNDAGAVVAGLGLADTAAQIQQ